MARHVTGVSPHPMLLVDCSQRESVLALAMRDPSGVLSVASRAFRATGSDAGGAAREPFWDELRALAAEAGVAPGQIASIAVAVGPGGFTGLRVSIAFAKAFALARGVPIVPVPSASLFAASDRARAGNGPWLVALAAKGATAWVATVRGDFLECDGAAVVDADAFAVLARQAAQGGGVLLADGHLDATLAERAREVGLSTRALVVDSGAFAAISAEIFARGGAVAPAALQPIYAREPEAVTNWRARASARAH